MFTANYSFVGWGVTVFDALDTMWIMGLDEQFYDAIHFVGTVDFFQTVRPNRLPRPY